jgi:queuosine precursor transporter
MYKSGEVIMNNTLLGLLFIVVHFGLVLFAYRQFGKTGLMVWIAISTILANIQVLKGIEIIGLQATLGNTLYGSIFFATDILSEKYGRKDAARSVYLGFFSAITLLITMQMALAFVPLQDDFALAVQDAFALIFEFSGRIVFASLTAYFISQLLDVTIYSKIRQWLPSDRWLWVRNNGSTMISQAIDTMIFVSIAFWGMSYDIMQIILSTYILKFMIAALDTPFLYLAKRIEPKSN